MKYLPLAGRICLALIFLNAGIQHLINYPSFIATIASQGLPLPDVLGIGAIVFLLLGSLSLILGYKSNIGAILLILFLIPTTIVFHPIASDLSGFLKNLGLVGGLLMIIHYGSGAVSLDSLSSG